MMDVATTILPLLITLFFAILIRKIVLWYTRMRRIYKLAAQCESPLDCPAHPLLGHVKYILDDEGFVQLAKSFKTPVGVAYNCSRVWFYINDADLVKEVLLNDHCLSKPMYMDYFLPARNSIFLIRDEHWRIHRKILNTSMTTNILTQYAKIFAIHDQKLADEVGFKHGAEFDMLPVIYHSSIVKFFDCAYGAEAGKYAKSICDSVEYLLTNFALRIRSVFYNIDLFYRLNGYDRKMKAHTKNLHDLTTNIIADRREIQNDNEEDAKQLIFIDFLLKCYENGSYALDELIAELVAFMVGGVNTCALTFSFICVLLGIYPDLQDKVYQEIKSVIDDKEFHPSDVSKMTYMQCFIKETLRLFPTSATNVRVASKDVKIGNYIFPKDSELHINVVNVHYSEKYYKNPKIFNPDRFMATSTEAQERHRYAHLPFLAGKRNCVGERFAYLSLMSSMVAVLQKFSIETSYNKLEDIRLGQMFSMTALDGFNVRMLPRK